MHLLVEKRSERLGGKQQHLTASASTSSKAASASAVHPTPYTTSSSATSINGLNYTISDVDTYRSAGVSSHSQPHSHSQKNSSSVESSYVGIGSSELSSSLSHELEDLLDRTLSRYLRSSYRVSTTQFFTEDSVNTLLPLCSDFGRHLLIVILRHKLLSRDSKFQRSLSLAIQASKLLRKLFNTKSKRSVKKTQISSSSSSFNNTHTYNTLAHPSASSSATASSSAHHDQENDEDADGAHMTNGDSVNEYMDTSDDDDDEYYSSDEDADDDDDDDDEDMRDSDDDDEDDDGGRVEELHVGVPYHRYRDLYGDAVADELMVCSAIYNLLHDVHVAC
jgi:hypothetical protein